MRNVIPKTESSIQVEYFENTARNIAIEEIRAHLLPFFKAMINA
jgi:hypothetical protein